MSQSQRWLRLMEQAPQKGKRTGYRRSAAEIAAVKEAIREILEDHHPQTVRQVYYQLVVRNLVRKTEGEYQRTAIRLLVQMRMDDSVPFDWIIDDSRTRVIYRTFNNLADAARDAAKYYRRNALAECPDYLEIFCEKQALVGFIHEAAGEYDVPVVPAHGAASLTQLYNTAVFIWRAWKAGKRSFIYQFGDHDASGVTFAEAIERRLIELCRKLGCPPPTFERVALTKEQIAEHNLPSRPSKTFEDGNPHARNWEGDSTELDALPADILQDIVRECIERHINPYQLETLREAEASEAEILEAWADKVEAAE